MQNSWAVSRFACEWVNESRSLLPDWQGISCLLSFQLECLRGPLGEPRAVKLHPSEAGSSVMVRAAAQSRAEQHTFRGLSYNPVAAQTSCVSLQATSGHCSSSSCRRRLLMVSYLVTSRTTHNDAATFAFISAKNWNSIRLQILTWPRNINLLKSPWERFHTFPPETTAGTHSCLDRMLMKEKHRKSRGFSRPRCTRTHTYTPCKCRNGGGLVLCSPGLECIAAAMTGLDANQGREVTAGVQPQRCRTPRAGPAPELHSAGKAVDTIPGKHIRAEQVLSHGDESLLPSNCTYEAQAAARNLSPPGPPGLC